MRTVCRTRAAIHPTMATGVTHDRSVPLAVGCVRTHRCWPLLARSPNTGRTNGRHTHAQKPATTVSPSTAVSAKRRSLGRNASRRAVPAATMAPARQQSAPLATSNSSPPSRPKLRSVTMPIGTPAALRTKRTVFRRATCSRESASAAVCALSAPIDGELTRFDMIRCFNMNCTSLPATSTAMGARTNLLAITRCSILTRNLYHGVHLIPWNRIYATPHSSHHKR